MTFGIVSTTPFCMRPILRIKIFFDNRNCRCALVVLYPSVRKAQLYMSHPCDARVSDHYV